MSEPLLTTARLILRRYRPDDLADFHEYISDNETVRYESYRPMTLAEARENLSWRISTEEMIAVELTAEHKLIGNVYLGKRDDESWELGYVFNRRYWRQGYASEACQALIAWAWAQGVHRLFAQCDPQNTASWKLLEHLGFTREAHLRKNVFFWRDAEGRPLWKDTFMYGLLAPEERDIGWETLIEEARRCQNEWRLSPLVEAGGVAAAILTAAGHVYTGVCIDTASTLGMCAERNAIANMITHHEQHIRRVVAIMPDGNFGAPCGACREMMMQIDPRNRDMEILMRYPEVVTVTLAELLPHWWGDNLDS